MSRFFFLRHQPLFRFLCRRGVLFVCFCNLFAGMVIGAFFLLPGSLSAQVQEDPLKAMILEKVIGYISWPEYVNATDDGKSLCIGVLGESSFGDFLQHAYKLNQRVVFQKKVKVCSIKEPEEMDQCHIVFIAGDEEQLLDDVLRQAEGKPILLVGDTKGFGDRGVHINFYVAREKIRFELNENALKNCGLSIDFRLRSVAKIVGPRSVGVK